MSPTLTLPEEAFLDHVDWHIECDEPKCGQPADWWGVCLKCQFHRPLCTVHQRMVVQVALRLESTLFTEVYCPECKVTVPASQWRDLLTFVPVTP